MPGVLLLVVGVLVAVGAPLVWSKTHQDPALRPIDQGVAVQLAQASVGAGDAATGSTPGSVRTDSSTPTSQTRNPSSTSTPAPRVSAGQQREKTTMPTTTKPTKVTSSLPVASRPARKPVIAAEPPAPAIGVPARLQIPAIDIDAPVEAVGVDAKGDMAVPEQVQQIGWYRFGAAPGSSAGSVVMSGHVDSAVQGLGAFSKLGDLKAGDAITVSDATGHRLRYHVVGREAFDKKTAPMADLFSRNGTARLTLITCGGDFDSSIRSYVDNIVVTAIPG